MEAVRSGNPRGCYRYDGFALYSGRNERLVMEQLLPGLHSCVSVCGTHLTLCVRSRHYLHSNWCSLELRLATLRLLVEHRDILILVFLEDIPFCQLSAYYWLTRLVRTYLDWPQDPGLQPAFWDCLNQTPDSDRTHPYTDALPVGLLYHNRVYLEFTDMLLFTFCSALPVLCTFFLNQHCVYSIIMDF